MTALLLSLLFSQGFFSPDEAATLFAQANVAYGREDPAAAEAGYRKLLDHGFGGANLRYNLGTACLAQGKLGPAVLELERARREGGGSDVDANLAVARARSLDQVIGAQGEEPFLQRLVGATSGRNAAAGFLVFWCGTFAALLAGRMRRRRAAAYAVAGLCGALCIPAGLLLAAHVWVAETIAEGVVLEHTVPVYALPQSTGKVSFELHAGLKLRMLEQAEGYVRVRLPNGLEGWAEARGITAIQ